MRSPHEVKEFRRFMAKSRVEYRKQQGRRRRLSQLRNRRRHLRNMEAQA